MNAIAITGEKFDVDETTRKYVIKKIGRLARYLPRHARRTASAEVKLRQIDQGHGNKYEAEIILHVPDKTLMARDSTMNVLAAVDIVEAKIVSQLRRYKEASILHISKRGILARMRSK